MDRLDKETFLKEAGEVLAGIADHLAQLPAVNLNELSPKNSVMVIIDLVNGFTREGALQSPRVAALIGEIAALAKHCEKLGIERLAFADSHSEASPEFKTYPPHCLTGTTETDLVDELQELGGITLFPKNSTNGFLEEAFQQWFRQHPEIDTFIITGDCTDICIQQFATTLKAWFNRQDRQARVIVPMNAVDTFDLGLHHGDLLNLVALYSMLGNGIEVVSKMA